MADNTLLNAGSGGNTLRTLEDASNVHHPVGVTAFATSVADPDVVAIVQPTVGLPVRLSDGSGYISALPVTDNGGALTVDGTVAATQSGTWNVGTVTTVSAVTAITNTVTVTGTGGTFPVTDSGGSLTVDNAALSVTGGGAEASALRVTLASDSTGVLSVDDNGGSLTVDGTVSVSGTVTVGTHDVTNAGTFAVQAAQSGTWNVGTVTAVTGITNTVTVTGTGGTFPVTDSGGSLTVDAPVGTPVFVRLSDGAAAITTLPVSLASVSSHAVTNAGTFAVQAAQSGTWDVGTVTTVTTCSTVTTLTGGGVAHDGADSGAPVKVGARATNVNLAAVSNNDRSDLVADLTGKLVTQPYSVPEVSVDGTASATNTSDTQVIAAQGAGVRIYVTTLILANSSSTNITVTIKSAATARLVVPVPANGGAVVPLPKPLRLAANEALNFAASSGVTTAYCSAVGFAAA